jgi:toxin-antitoxin system PIN domain toxin
MKVALLDVNVLIALFDPAHPNHDEAHEWFGRHERYGWATSTITISGCVRVLSNPAYPTVRARPDEVVAHLRQMCRSPHHKFWSDSTTLLDPGAFRPELIGSHRKVTDICLLALACRNEGRLATFDRSIPLKAVVGAKPEHLFVIGAPARS